jgi:ABC-type multidrug transport system ATPase subunit
MQDEQNYILKIENLKKDNNYFIYNCCHKKKYSITSLDNINLNIQENECYGILGSNGSGKTTILKCITQEIVQTEGEILFNNQDINGKFNQLKGKIGFYPQYNILFESLSVYNNLEFYSKIKGIDNKVLS